MITRRRSVLAALMVFLLAGKERLLVCEPQASFRPVPASP